MDMNVTADRGPATADGIGADAEPGDLYGPPDPPDEEDQP